MAKLVNIKNKNLHHLNSLMMYILIMLLVAFKTNAQLEETTNYNRREHSLTTPFLGIIFNKAAESQFIMLIFYQMFQVLA